MNYDSRLWPDSADELQQVAPAKRDAAGGRREARPRHVDEYGAAAAGHARTGIVVDLDENVVEPVVPPQPVARLLAERRKGLL